MSVEHSLRWGKTPGIGHDRQPTRRRPFRGSYRLLQGKALQMGILLRWIKEDNEYHLEHPQDGIYCCPSLKVVDALLTAIERRDKR